MKLARLELGDAGLEVREVQEALLRLGYDLPKHGAEGIVTLEFIDELEEFAKDHGLEGQVNDSWEWYLDPAVTGSIICHVLEMVQEVTNLRDGTPQQFPDTGVDFHDISDTHPRKAAKGVRPWKQVTGITLHQTGIMLGNTLKRFQSLKAHIGILNMKRPTIVQVYPLNTLLHHGNAFNDTDVGIEVNGCFEGIDGAQRTAWKGGYTKQPRRATEQQLVATRDAVRRIINTVKSHGGNVTHIHAHRQTSAMRRSDPGSRIWKAVGVWAQQEYGLSDGGDGFTRRNGLAIPTEWDESRTASY